MIGLLVSVRSEEEAHAAVSGGASVVDVKEPDRGPLGRADPEVWRAVRSAVPPSIPVSLALGELVELERWIASHPMPRLAGIDFLKVALAEAGPSWPDDWARIRAAFPAGPRWVAVAYADWREAGSPRPDDVLDAALVVPDCCSILVDTWDKAHPTSIEPTQAWMDWVQRARRGGLRVTLAGGLDLPTIRRLAPLRPELFAVRGAACHDSRRESTIDPRRVADLVAAVQSIS